MERIGRRRGRDALVKKWGRGMDREERLIGREEARGADEAEGVRWKVQLRREIISDLTGGGVGGEASGNDVAREIRQ
jgi:hypothetical protein